MSPSVASVIFKLFSEDFPISHDCIRLELALRILRSQVGFWSGIFIYSSVRNNDRTLSVDAAVTSRRGSKSHH